jgi:hypothetical protein
MKHDMQSSSVNRPLDIAKDERVATLVGQIGSAKRLSTKRCPPPHIRRAREAICDCTRAINESARGIDRRDDEILRVGDKVRVGEGV